MGSVFDKLNLKDQRELVVLSAPPSFEPELRKLAGVTVKRRLPPRGPVSFVMVFATQQREVDAVAAQLARLAPGDAIVWFAYPKGSSKRYTCSFNRDTGWKTLGQAGFEAVRQIAIDEDWSALRFRRAEYIKSMKRAPERAMSRTGRTKVAEGHDAARSSRTGSAVSGAEGGRSTATKRQGPSRAAQPVLLAGGNPQIAKADGDAPVQVYIAAMPGWRSNVGRRLDALVVRTVPGVRKAVKWNSPFYGIEGKGWFVSFHTFANYVKVTFFQGTSLRPVPPGGRAKEARWIDIHEDDLDEARLAMWIRQAATLPGWGKS